MATRRMRRKSNESPCRDAKAIAGQMHSGIIHIYNTVMYLYQINTALLGATVAGREASWSALLGNFVSRTQLFCILSCTTVSTLIWYISSNITCESVFRIHTRISQHPKVHATGIKIAFRMEKSSLDLRQFLALLFLLANFLAIHYLATL